jgi:hypothetical protein
MFTRSHAVSARAALVALCAATVSAQTPLGSGFTYQGRLDQNGQPFSGSADLVFKLYDAAVGGASLGTHAINGVGVSDGLFAVILNTGGEFGGGAFDGNERWLEITVNQTPMVPRQPLTAAPYALYSASGSATALQGRPLHPMAPGPGQVIKWDGATWLPADESAGGLATVTHDTTLTGQGTVVSPLGVAIPLVLTGTVGAPDAIITGNNNGTGDGVRGEHVASGNLGLLGTASSGVSGFSSAYGVYAVTDGTDGRALFAHATSPTGPAYGVYARSDSSQGIGVFGWATAASGPTAGIYGFTANAGGYAVYGLHGANPDGDPQRAGVTGESTDLAGVAGYSQNRDGVHGRMERFGTFALGSANLRGGVHGEAATADTPDNFGVVGTASAYGTGVLGVGSNHGHGVAGVAGNDEPHTSAGVLGMTREGSGGGGGWPPHFGLNLTSEKGMVGVLGQAYNRVAVWGESVEKIGVLGTTGDQLNGAMLPAGSFGVYGRASQPAGVAVFGQHASGSSGALGAADAGVRGSGNLFGVVGMTTNLIGVQGTNTAAGTMGLLASTSAGVSGNWPSGNNGLLASATYGAMGQAVGSGTFGVFAQHLPTGNEAALAGEDFGVSATGPVGVSANSNVESGTGVIGQADTGTGAIGIQGQSRDGYGVVGSGGLYGVVGSGGLYGVYSFGDFAATGTKSFRIDHPLDPENKYLLHYCSEGPEQQNVYNGIVLLDASGEAHIELPAYFASISREPRYALTPMGAPMPDLHVAEEIDLQRAPCSFRVAGGAPGRKVSWEVKAVRNDRWVQTHGAPVEVDKGELERGRYQHPELHGRPDETGMNR